MKRYYLMKSGKSHGPFTAEELNGLRANGQIYDYAWLWDQEDQAKGWQPIELPAPPGASEIAAAPSPSAPVVVKPTPAQPTLRGWSPSGIEAICHDYRQIVSGTLSRVTEAGCELVTTAGTSPSFREKARVYLNLLDTRTGRTVDVEAQLSSVLREKGHWTYRLEWQDCPELLRQAA